MTDFLVWGPRLVILFIGTSSDVMESPNKDEEVFFPIAFSLWRRTRMMTGCSGSALNKDNTPSRYQVLCEVAEAISAHRNLDSLFHDLAGRLHQVIDFDFLVLILFDAEKQRTRLHVLEGTLPTLVGPGFELPVEESPSGIVVTTQKAYVISDIEKESFFPRSNEIIKAHGVRAYCIMPLTTAQQRLGVLGFGSTRPGCYDEADLDFLRQVSAQVAVAVDNALVYQKLAELNDLLNQEKLYLEDELRTHVNFEEIVGQSAVLQRVLKAVETVASTDSTVLILGETGTGKELIARAVHGLSSRKARTLVKINCAAIPTGLLESELFGHERGAFTGALAQKKGRFELADGGTLFLDEVGDIPLELQSKLLRVIQEKEFERLGSNKTIRVDVRLVAATNRNLEKMVAEGEFRQDLFYRLKVFPLELPSLRERLEDLPLLVSYFVQKFARRMNKPIESISSEDLFSLQRWHWPGNIRELENLVERAVILSNGPVLRLPLAEFNGGILSNVCRSDPAPFSMVEAEKRHIRDALEKCGWKLSGQDGAAALLGMKRTTLQSRMKKLGISRSVSRSG
jgi:formate hydrogenlyase transcriptional activator